MRLVTSTEVPVSSVAGESPLAAVFRRDTVGSESSSATNGSSVARVAGKNRLPANPCAKADSVTVVPAKAHAKASKKDKCPTDRVLTRRTVIESDSMIGPLMMLLLMVRKDRPRAGSPRAAGMIPRDSYRGRGGARGAANAMIGLVVQVVWYATNACSERWFGGTGKKHVC